jgi:predicted permease
MRQITEHFCYQLKQALLSLKQKPSFVLSVVATMSLTLGALLCVTTLAYVMLIKPLPYSEQHRLYHIEHQLINDSGIIDGRAFIYPNLMHIYNKQTLFEQTALFYHDGDVITSQKSEPMVAITYVSPEWFNIFDVKMVIGRGFEITEAINSQHPVAVISHKTWQETFDGAKDIIERSITIGEKNFKVIGVIEKDYKEINGEGFISDLYLPWDFNSVTKRDRRSWGNDDSNLGIVGQINTAYQDYSPEKISELLTREVNDNWQTKIAGVKFFKGWSTAINIKSLKSYVIADKKQSIYLLIIGVFGLVIIASTNIVNLFISRTVERRDVLAIIAAVGAKKRQLFWCVIAETGVLMLLAILLAQPIMQLILSILQYSLVGYLPRIKELQINTFSLIMSLFLVLAFTLLFSKICCRMVNYKNLKLSLQASGKGNGIQVSKKIRKVLIIGQMVTAMVMIFVNLVLYKEASNVVNQALGYNTERITAAVLVLPKSSDKSGDETLTRLKNELLVNPKIMNISQGMRPTAFRTIALTLQGSEQRYTASAKDIDEHYFAMIGQGIKAGDNFSNEDIKDRNRVIIVNEVFAKKIAPMGSPIGLKFQNGMEIIGIVKNIKLPGESIIRPRFYYPTRLSRNMLLIETQPEHVFTREEMITTLKTVDKNLSLFSFMQLAEYKKQRLFTATAAALTTIGLAFLTVLLSGLGLYGILSYSTQMRQFEIGTRLAIGAKGKDIVWLVLKENMSALATGLCISVLLLIGLYFSFAQYLTSYISTELLTPLLVTFLLISLLSFLSCYLPLRQYINKPAIHSLKSND